MAKKKEKVSLDENEQEIAGAEESESDCVSEDTVRVFKSEFDALRRELEGAKREASKMTERALEMTTQAQRLQAEFDNYRKRTNETNKKVRVDGIIEVLSKILPVLDAIEQAKTMIKDESTLSGIDIIDRQLGDLLSSFNVERIDALGAPFDPNLHNAVMEEEVEEANKGKVVKIYQQGYKIGDRVLRHSVVIVGK